MTVRRPTALALLSLVIAILLAVPAWAGPPTETLRKSIEEIFALLDNPSLKGARNVAERQRALRALAEDTIDFREAARRTLGASWEARSTAERDHFVKLFADLIDHGYLGRVSHDGERILYDDELVTGAQAIVRVRAVARSGDVTPVLFAMREGDDGRWRVFDVSVGGMSLVGTYRAQFSRIIRVGSYEDLVSRLESKTKADLDASVSTISAP
jgi:phospholipid transport system substrate-binding protein